MKQLSDFSNSIMIYSETNHISMKWFKAYVKVLLPIRIVLSILSFISSLGNVQNKQALYGEEWSGIIILGFMIDIIVLFIRCYTYTSMKNLKSNGYKSNVVLMIAELFTMAFIYLSISISYAIIPIAIYTMVWFVPNCIYFKKRQSIFDSSFSYTKNDNYEESVYNNFDVFGTCPNCGKQNQSVKCFSCGLTKEEASRIKSEKPKQNEDISETKLEQEAQTKDNTANSNSNEFNFCNKCGSKIDDDFAFCNKCGNKVR